MLVGVPSAKAWLPGTYPVATRGFSVDRNNRNDVLAFWHAVYKASEGYEARIKWTGNYTGNNGTTSAAFVGDVERRLNFFRALSGVNTNSKVSTNSPLVIDLKDPLPLPIGSTLKSTAAQSAALMLVRNYDPGTGKNPAMTHNPPSNLIGWSPMAWNAVAKGNFAFGAYGPGAILEYMKEEQSSSLTSSSANNLVGHRRWNLHPEATVYATGDQPGKSAYVPPTNVLYVSQSPLEILPQEPAFVAYPAPGFFPVDLNSRFWSLSCKGADFTKATVQMKDSAGKAVALVATRRDSSYGDPAIIWELPTSAQIRTVYNDTAFDVSVTGVSGPGVPDSYSYKVTLINPNRLLSSQAITGAASLSAKKTGSYTFVPPAGAEGLQVVAAKKSAVAWKETAEVAKDVKVIDGTGANYPLIVKTAAYAGFGAVVGKCAFQLTFPTSYDLLVRGIPDQTFELDRDILVKSGGKLGFKFRRGFMTKASTLVVEASATGGVSWVTVGKPIVGVSDTKYDLKVSTFSAALPASTEPIRIRFRYYASAGAVYTHEAAPKSPTGIFIDDIQVLKCDTLETKKVTTLAGNAKSFTLNATTAGAKLVNKEQWSLRLRTKLGNNWFPAGPSKAITITP
ncbi:hypothetical protein JIN84_07325 [Luteolibacter yonseiensis]|uniref:Uncharacterized protein n=2 Tax=Luteolibacter yonseiensis TaxID=1144680 RepID=A0A934QZ72_9BACT|nr:hypothetical protein [Luteolibacter yonseiensis]MBK1815418.1 hypothetical protein [Luteolibacter yonseiensis]